LNRAFCDSGIEGTAVCFNIRLCIEDYHWFIIWQWDPLQIEWLAISPPYRNIQCSLAQAPEYVRQIPLELGGMGNLLDLLAIMNMDQALDPS
jgi:hypothetical protein